MYLFENLVSRAVEKAKDKKTRVIWKPMSKRTRILTGMRDGIWQIWGVDIAEIDDEIEDIMGISKPNDVTEIKAAADNCNEEIHMVEPVNDLVG